MTTRSSIAKSLLAVPAVMLLLASPTTAFAESKAEATQEPAAEEPASKESTSTAESAKKEDDSPKAEVSAVAGASAEPSKAASASAEPSKAAGEAAPSEDSPAITEIGVQRLPGSAYPQPQTRGLKYGSLWLTFHGLQWPYMPATSKGSRFVIGFSGWGWVDTSYEKFAPWGDNSTVVNSSRIRYWKQQSRLLLRVTPTYSFDNDWFVQGQAELVATEDQTAKRGDPGGADTDDLYLRVGQWNKWDFQAGRFEGWEVFHLGMGLDQNTFERKGAVGPGESSYDISFYGLTDNQFRPQGPAGNLAFHYFPLRILRFELLGMAGTLGTGPALATRPVAILDLGWLKLKGGVEYQRQVAVGTDDQTKITSKGVGGAAQFVFEPHIEFGVNAAQGTVWNIDSNGRLKPEGSYTRTSYGGFANMSNGSLKHPLILGLGAMYTRTEDQKDTLQNGVVDAYWLFQSFAALQYVAFEQLYIKLVGGYSKGHWTTAGNDPPIEFNDKVYSLRLRLSFYF